ncbi:glutamate-5-semialdehyde dehydrogenase [Planctobacterium marinum]|uniref:glutamate-5-semialdehyde dehydrogenase n=1 Tax=Planctobacterium marinum TaxID=1631968 RepID=UPI001E328427|nr:glutamate-5-semialdehyde dehydrogenase [Planctobacterium marinum]MCC2607522.1 glutamate-5-semialdehyde dehydrogenase [Planctobacterium marinum]
MNIRKELQETAKAAKHLVALTTEEKNKVLLMMAFAVEQNEEKILEENKRDLALAKEQGLSDAMMDRLALDKERLSAIVKSIEDVAKLDDPVGKMRPLNKHENGLEINKVRVPLGVIGMIYEARPNVAAEASALCFKSGNAIVLRCGKEAIKTSFAIVSAMQSMLISNGLPADAIKLITDPDRKLMLDLIQQDDLLDVIIPRGGEGLIRFVTENSRVPVIQHYKGVCHLFVDESAEIEKAVSLFLNGKTQRPGVCNALEGLLIHKDIAQDILPQIQLHCGVNDIRVHACERSYPYFEHMEGVEKIANDEFGEEYLAKEIAIRIVDDIHDAIDHIDQFGSKHTEVICTENPKNAELFQKIVDASVVMVNASSRFSDGGQLGLGAEIGIATTKLHAYGPMGLEALTTEKYLVNGNGQIRA